MGSRPSKVVICTVAEGSHFEGLPALLNSLHRSGARGDVVVGYRGALPNWTHDQTPCASPFSDIALDVGGLRVSFLQMEGEGLPLPMLKPKLMLHCLVETCNDVHGVLFLDSDVVCHAPWSFFEDWLSTGLMLVSDYSHPIVPIGHPWRKAWADLITASGYEYVDRHEYCLSGCVGVPLREKSLLDVWLRLSEELLERSPDLVKFKSGDRILNPFFGTDQDLLNSALMVYEGEVSPVDCGFLGFRGSIQFLVHPVGEKPWKKNIWTDWLIRGRVPNLYDISYFGSLSNPIRHSQSKRLVSARLVRALGRFYRA